MLFLYEILRYLAAVAWSNLDFPAAEFFDFVGDNDNEVKLRDYSESLFCDYNKLVLSLGFSYFL